jgi:hypothetical protein
MDMMARLAHDTAHMNALGGTLGDPLGDRRPIRESSRCGKAQDQGRPGEDKKLRGHQANLRTDWRYASAHRSKLNDYWYLS